MTTPDGLREIILILFGGGGISALVMAIRAFIHGRHEDTDLEGQISDRIQEQATRWLERSEERLRRAEKRLEATELQLAETREQAAVAEKRANHACRELRAVQARASSLEERYAQAIAALSETFTWIESGCVPPPPTRPEWAR